jgi:hypothetical protein
VGVHSGLDSRPPGTDVGCCGVDPGAERPYLLPFDVSVVSRDRPTGRALMLCHAASSLARRGVIPRQPSGRSTPVKLGSRQLDA